STVEAQVFAAKDVADQVADVLSGRPAAHAVNAPFIPTETIEALRPYMSLAAILGKMAYKLGEGQTEKIRIRFQGEISEYDTSLLKALVLGGLMEGTSEERVNIVNANYLSERRGIKVVDEKISACENYSSLVAVEVQTSAGMAVIAGTVMNGETHIVRINDYWLDIVPTGVYFMLAEHTDRPGLIGAVGKITGDADVNVSYMHLSRLQPRGQALMVLAMDEELGEDGQQKILSLPGVASVKVIKI
ncbi:phosphoglycerate dehydrogenase, partial [Chloroflexota bacterium]